MARPKEPIELVVAKGKKNLTKAEIEERKNSEISAPSDRVEAPSYLSAAQKRRFKNIAEELLRIGIMSNLDCDTLARYIQSEEKYKKYNKLVDDFFKKSGKKGAENSVFEMDVGRLEKLEGLRDKALKQCRAMAQDLGLTISSRCRLVVPKAPETKKKNKFQKFEAG